MSAPSLAEAQSLFNAGRTNEAVHMIRTVASSGDPQGLFILAGMFWSGSHVAQDPVRGRMLYEFASQGGHPQASVIATNLLASGIAGKRDWAAALAQLQTQAHHDRSRRRILDLLNAMSLDQEGNPAQAPESELLSERPFVRIVRGLATRDECKHVINVATPEYRPSLVHDDAGDLVRDTIRTSDGAPIHWAIEDPAIHALNRRIGAAIGTPYENGETLQSLRYAPGQEYRPHFDYVADDNRRLWTALLYLNDDYEGGETTFLRTGLSVKGHIGDALVFANATADGEFDELAEHSGEPVKRGVKYLATRWIREKRFIV
jgi:prolyl 4-hydroxylase